MTVGGTGVDAEELPGYPPQMNGPGRLGSVGAEDQQGAVGGGADQGGSRLREGRGREGERDEGGDDEADPSHAVAKWRSGDASSRDPPPSARWGPLERPPDLARPG